MNVDFSRSLLIQLHDKEVDAMLNVAALARMQLDKMPVVHMPGCPILRKGDLMGNELNNVENLLNRILED